MFSKEFAFRLFINYAHMIMQMIARAYDQIWKKNCPLWYHHVVWRNLPFTDLVNTNAYYYPMLNSFFLFEGSLHLKN